jgi:hypothetical protein
MVTVVLYTDYFVPIVFVDGWNHWLLTFLLVIGYDFADGG